MKTEKKQFSLLIRLRLKRCVNADIPTRFSLVEIGYKV
mgnify:CR=1 FL=1